MTDDKKTTDEDNSVSVHVKWKLSDKRVWIPLVIAIITATTQLIRLLFSGE